MLLTTLCRMPLTPETALTVPTPTWVIVVCILGFVLAGLSAAFFALWRRERERNATLRSIIRRHLRESQAAGAPYVHGA